MMTLLATCVLAANFNGVSNLVANGPDAQHSAVKDVATMVGATLWAPDKTARGFTMRSIELVKVPASGAFAKLGERSAVRMRFINKSTSTAFDIYQLPTAESVDATKHSKWLIDGGFFEGGISHLDTFVGMKRGTMDVAFVGGLVSEPSAKELLKRLVAVEPELSATRTGN